MARNRVKRGTGNTGGGETIPDGNKAVDSGMEGSNDGAERTTDASNDGATKFRIIDPTAGDGDASGSGDANGDKPKRKHGIDNRTGAHHKRKTAAENLAGIESLLLSIHLMTAGILKCPELVIDDKFAGLLADAIRRVASHYDAAFISEKQQAWVNLAMVGGGGYGVRLLAIRNRLAKEAKPAGPKPVEFPSANAPKARAANAAAGGFTPSDIFGREGPKDD